MVFTPRRQVSLGRVLLCTLAAIACGACGPSPSARSPESPRSTNYADLVAVFNDFRRFALPKTTDGVPDYSVAAMDAQRRELVAYERRLSAIDPSGWSIPERVDYLLVRAEIRGLDFEHRVHRPWARDPGFYITTYLGFGPSMHGSLRIPREPGSKPRWLAAIKMPIPARDLPEFTARLRAVPSLLEQAQRNLTEPAGDLARLAIKAKAQEITIYHDLAQKMAGPHPDLVADANRAAAACEEFRQWLIANEPKWTTPAGLGVENYNWWLKNVQLVPYTWDEIRAMGEREYARSLTFLKLEQQKSRGTPMLAPVKTEAEYRKQYVEADADLLDFLRRQQIMTVPAEFVPEPPEPFIRPNGPRDFFEQSGDRDPRPLRAHNTAGHQLDRFLRERDSRPIRGARRLYFIDGIRSDGFAFYLEEMTTQGGWLDARPKAREINYIMQVNRAARVAAELRMHSNELPIAEAVKQLIASTPAFMVPDDPVAWYDLELYLRQPGYGVGYFLGKVQIEQLLADRAQQLGQTFTLRGFHDQLLAAGMIPVSLIRWEMTGRDDQVKTLW